MARPSFFCNFINQGDNVAESSGVLFDLNDLLGEGLTLADACSKIDVAVRMYKSSRDNLTPENKRIVIGVQHLPND